jgi:hypothetical protein
MRTFASLKGSPSQFCFSQPDCSEATF